MRHKIWEIIQRLHQTCLKHTLIHFIHHGFFRNFIGKLVKAEFLLGSAGMQDRIGILVDVGASYIVLRSVQDNNLLYCDIFSIKFLTISQQPFMYNPTQQLGIQNSFTQMPLM